MLNFKNWLIGKDPDAGEDWRQEEKGTAEDEMARWAHQLDWHEFEQAPGIVDGQGSLPCCSLWGFKESDTTERLNWAEFMVSLFPLFFLTASKILLPTFWKLLLLSNKPQKKLYYIQ